MVFKGNLAEVDRLINFDRELLLMIENTLENLNSQLKSRIADERLNGGRALTLVRGIRSNDTLRTKYQAIYNQALVLLVSHFASALGDVFRHLVAARLASSNPGKLLDEEFRLTVADLRDRDWSLAGALPDLLIAKYDFTFQDMGATVRAFTNYAGVNPVRDVVMNNIIAAQAFRHSIVHAGGKVGTRLIKQVSNAHPRTFRPNVQLDEQLGLTLAELDSVKSDMLRFIESLSC